MTTYAGHYTDPPRDSSGNAIPNATFQLYVPGSKVAPVYYTDRTKGTPVAGDPKSDAFGNVSIWPDPGIYEYWFQGQFIQLVTVDMDDAEPQAEVNTAVSTINATLASTYYTKTQVDAAIASNGAPGVGAELTANKNQNSGYAGLNSSGYVAFAQLPPTLEVTTNKNANSGYCGLNSSGKVALAQLNVGALVGTNVTAQTANYTATAGDFVLCDSTGGAFTVTLPSAVLGQAPITVKLYNGTNSISITGSIEGSTQTIAIATSQHTLTFVSDGTYWYRAHSYQPLSILARTDQDNNFNGHVLTNFAEKVVTVSTSTYTAGTDGYGIHLRWSNAGGGTITLPNSAPAGSSIIVHQAAAGQVTVSSGSGASFSEPDGLTKTAKQTAAIVCTVLNNPGGTSATWVVGGYSA